MNRTMLERARLGALKTMPGGGGCVPLSRCFATRPRRITRRDLLKGSLAVGGGAALAPLLAACGNEQQASLGANERASIEFWHMYPGAARETIKELLRRFNEKNPNITVTDRLYPGYSDIVKAVQAALAANEPPPATAAVGYEFLRYAAEFFPHTTIEEAAARDEGGTEWLSQNFAPNILDLGRVNGTLHGMPYSLGSPLLIYNRDLFGQAGLDRAPRTWTELREYARRIKEATGKMGLYMIEFPGSWWVDQGLMESNGATPLAGSEDEGWRVGIDSPEAAEAMQLWGDMVNEDETCAHLEFRQGEQGFVSGEIAMFVASNVEIRNSQQGADFELGTAAFPTFGDKPTRVPGGGFDIFIFAEEEPQQLAAWEFIKYMNSPESLTTWVKGISLIPPREGVADDPRHLKPFIENNPLVKPGFEAAPDIVPWTSFPGRNGLEANQMVSDAREKILQGQDAASALGESATRVRELIQG